VVVIAVWQYVGERDMLARGLFPSATDSLEALMQWVFGERGSDFFAGTWIEALQTSVLRVLLGFLIGTAVGVVLGLLSGVSRGFRRCLDPSVNMIRPISVTAWVPMALILFGIGYKPAIFLTALATFFPIYVNTLSGARYSEGSLVQAAQMLGADRRQILRRVTLPATLPSIAVGMRVAAAIAWTTVVVAEMLGAKSGLGYTLMLAYSQFRFDYVVAAMVSIGLCGYLTDKLLEHLVERRIRWMVGRSTAQSR
jgi:NitT/TauT family transport system permease protein